MEYGSEYPEAAEDYTSEGLEYPEQEQRPAWQKRASASSFISLGKSDSRFLASTG